MTPAAMADPGLSLRIVQSLLQAMEVQLELELSPWAPEVPEGLYELHGETEVKAVWGYFDQAARLQSNFEKRQAEKRRQAASRMQAKIPEAVDVRKSAV